MPRKKRDREPETGKDTFIKGMIYVLGIIAWVVVMYAGRTAFTSLPIFNLLITFGGISTYDQTVVTGVVTIIIVMVLDVITD